MKAYKFWVGFIAASLSANAPVAWASMDIAQKSAFNRTMREKFNGTFNEIYEKNAHFFDYQSRSVLEAWLQSNGNQKATFPQSQIVKDKNGKESVKMILSHGGKTATLTFTEGNDRDFDLNGTKISFTDLRNISDVAAKLGKTDSSFASVSKSIEYAQLPEPKKTDSLSPEEFAKLKPIERVEYLMLMRQTMEAAQEVLNEVQEKQQVSNEKNSPSYVLNPLLASEVATADPAPKGKKAKPSKSSSGSKSQSTAPTLQAGDKCLVAGNISVYERNGGGRLYCNPFPKSIATTKPSPVFHDRCDKSGTPPSTKRPQGRGDGRGNVACPSLLYEPQSNGRPYCQWSSDQPFFTQSATANCNSMSPLKGELNTKERLASYERILKGYYTMNGGDADKIKDCFNEEHKVSKACVSIFQPQLDAFHAFKADVDQVCKTADRKASDQPLACEKLKERMLELIDFVEKAKNDPTPIVTPPIKVDPRQDDCIRAGLAWEDGKCVCPGGKAAEFEKGKGNYFCPIVVAPPIVEEKEVKEKDECKNEKGEKSNSIKCNPVPWLLGAAALIGLFWLIGRKGSSDKGGGPGTTVPGGTLPPPVITMVPGTTMPPTTMPPTTMPPAPTPGEGGTGRGGGRTGGGRGAQ